MPADSPPLRPDPPPPERAGAHFSLVPDDAVLALAAARRLHRADPALLLALLTHRRRRDETNVHPHQATLARRLDCSVRTVQRGLGRLENAGLIARRSRRDGAGRMRGLCYDLAPLIALLPPPQATTVPAHATPVSPGRRRGEGAVTASLPSRNGGFAHATSTRHGCRLELDASVVAEIDNRRLAPRSPGVVADFSFHSQSPAAGRLQSVGVFGPTAARLASQHGEARCGQVLDALARRPKVRDRAAWCVRCLSEGWPLDGPAPRTPAPRPVHIPAPPAAPDPLAALPPDRLLALEREARARLCGELPALRPILEKGRRTPHLRLKMAALLAEQQQQSDSERTPREGRGTP